MSITLKVAIARAWAVAKHNFHRAVAYLIAAKVSVDAAIALAARFHGAQVARSA
jgi:hypothetical protein